MSPSIRCPKLQGLGWIPDIPDHRDRTYAAPMLPPNVAIPRSVDLRPHCPAVYDQLSLGSCTANAIAAAIQFDQMRQKFASPFTPSRLFIYYNERTREHTISSDSGASLRDGIKSIASQGACPEDLWPYLDDAQTFAKPPPKICYDVASQHRAVSYARVPRVLAQFRGCLASGYPFTYGFSVYDSFMSNAVAATGVVPMPGPNEQLLGGHAVLAVGYDDVRKMFISRNSWNASWGLGGYFLMPYEYVLDPNLSDDFWTVRVVQ
jgi:C1A family cysteine protease